MLRTWILAEDEWFRLRDLRLTALRESPRAFLSSYQRESIYCEAEWRTELSRGNWLVAAERGRTVGLLGVTQEVSTPPNECYLEFLWVSPRFRRSGVATSLMKAALKDVLRSEITTVWVWVLNGNEPARHLYERFGFVRTGVRQSLSNNPSRCEELMKLALQ